MGFWRQLRTLALNYWTNERINYSIKVFVALTGATLPSWYIGEIVLIAPMVLGVIAAALAESDDSLLGRVKSIFMMLICFAIAGFTTQLLLPYPLLFVSGMFVSTVGFIMLGAMGPRYANIAFASILLAIYTMISSQTSAYSFEHPLRIMYGVCWYSALSLLWQLLSPTRPVRQALKVVYEELATYITIKSQLFDYLPGEAHNSHYLLLMEQNAKVVAAMNVTKEALVRRRYLHNSDLMRLYFLSQEVHERVSASHADYQQLNRYFAHSDVLFRVKQLLEFESKACRRIAHSLLINRPYHHRTRGAHIGELAKQSANALPIPEADNEQLLITRLKLLVHNLQRVDYYLNPCNDYQLPDDTALSDSHPLGLKAHIARVKAQCRWGSPLFHHAIRLALALCTGYGIITLFHLHMGYWILLTTLFVLQSSFKATWHKLRLRILGTISGLLLGAPLIYLFPGQEGQLVLLVIIGVIFFLFRMRRYGIATCAITLVAMICFDQQGLGFEMVIPRLVDTLIGCGLAVSAVMFIMPDWQFKRLPQLMATSLEQQRIYLQQILAQYHTGKQDTLCYRIARREAHNADAQLYDAVTAMMVEPKRYQLDPVKSFQFLEQSHRLLNFISTLGTHRQKLSRSQWQSDVTGLAYTADGCFYDIISDLRNEKNDLSPHPLMEDTTINGTEPEALISQQLLVIIHQLIRLREVINP